MMLALLGPLLNFGLLCSAHRLLDLVQPQAEYSLHWPRPTSPCYVLNRAEAL